MLHRARYNALLLCSAAAIGLSAMSGQANAAEPRVFDIEAQPLATALMEFGNQSGVAVVAPGGLTLSKTTSRVSGNVEPEVALQMMLAGTGLTYRREGDLFAVVQEGVGGSPQEQGAVGTGASTVEALIVTAQKKEEAIQDVPIAISAFTQKSLDEQKIEGGFDLLKAIPNVTFSKSNFTGYNFSIRGIGTKAVSATTDPAVAVSMNNTTLIVNRLFEQEYVDMERVEVLRGPQGTLYGRNATSGVINAITAKPRLGDFEAEAKLETGNYNARRFRGMVNVPIGETLAVRGAFALTKRDGYGVNEAASDPNIAEADRPRRDVDDRDLWTGRLTIGWEPDPRLRVNLMWERFEEDDQRVRTSKQLCKHDPGPDSVRDFDWSGISPGDPYGVIARSFTSQGCLPVSLYSDEAFGTPNGASLPYLNGLFIATTIGQVGGIVSGGTDGFPGLGGNPYYSDPTWPPFFGGPIVAALEPPCEAAAVFNYLFPLDICNSDPYGGRMQSPDLRTIYSKIEPIYRASSDVFDLSIELELTEALTFQSQTVFAKDEVYSSQDYNRFTTVPIFNDSSTACDFRRVFGFRLPDCSSMGTYADGFYNITPGGYFDDPQLGRANTIVAQDLSQAKSEQFNQEFRLASNFDSAWNFSLGANFTRFETINDYYVFINALTYFTHFFPFNVHEAPGYFPACADDPNQCVYVDPNPLESINGEGHNYFRSANPYKLRSTALFGELYWQATDTVKVTLGARMTWDEKVFTPIPSQLLLYDYRYGTPEGGGPEDCVDPVACRQMGTGVGGRGSPPNADIVQEWREPTGRMIVDWKPDLDFTDETMVYASIAHGYKGGGANPPNISPPAGIYNALNSGGVNPPTFEPEFIDAFEVGTKNTLLDGALILNGAAFYYDYESYQVSKIVDRSAYNENFDAKVWGLELEWMFSPTRNLRFNGTFGALRTEIAGGEQSIDLMDRTQEYTTGQEQTFGKYTGWVVLKPWIANSSNCIAPKEVAAMALDPNALLEINFLCPGGNLLGRQFDGSSPGFFLPNGGTYDPATEAPNGGAGFFADLGGHELPNAPHWTASLGAQYRFALPGGWDATLRSDFYYQSQSFARVYNTQYDKLRAWTNTNISLWVENPDWGVTAEVYVKNAFDEEPITDSFLNSDDSGLTTNVFTLDPRLVGVSVRKRF